MAFNFSKVFSTGYSLFLEFPVSELSTNLLPRGVGIITLFLKMNGTEQMLLQSVFPTPILIDKL